MTKKVKTAVEQMRGENRTVLVLGMDASSVVLTEMMGEGLRRNHLRSSPIPHLQDWEGGRSLERRSG